jgi:hypothetical protein
MHSSREDIKERAVGNRTLALSAALRHGSCLTNHESQYLRYGS